MDGTSSGTGSSGVDRSNLVIVALPSKEDYVWKTSSEKIPHLTLMYLGEPDAGVSSSHISEFLEHVANTSLKRFSLDVDYRGELGDNKADVLFFREGYQTKELELIRSYLLGNTEIARAYHSTDQFSAWTPHLTLGYPETPAKPDDRDYPGINWVNFDRVALWTGYFEGPEFRLKDHDMGEVRMSAIKLDRPTVVDNVLAHVGVKGMKWGVRRSNPSGSSSSKSEASDDFKAALVAKSKSSSSLSNGEMQALITRMELEKRYVSVMSTPRSTTRKVKAAKFVGTILADVGKEQLIRVARAQATKTTNTQALKRGLDIQTELGTKKKEPKNDPK